MIKWPKSKQEWLAVGQKWFGGYLRLKITFMLIGAGAVFVAQLFTGFWTFRESNEALLRQQWQAVIESQSDFETELSAIDDILRGQPSTLAGREYGSTAQTYIRAMEAVSRSLPDTSDEIQDYIDAIATLRHYYDGLSPPQPNTEEWVLFYGEFRVDYDQYVQARERYFNVVAAELGDYARYVTNL